MEKRALSVCLITYNHINYIRQAIDSVIMQKVNFSWELIIADDFSTDGTREIIKEYKEKYPEFIRLILQEKNVGPAQNWIDLMKAPESKFVSYFEGDDYWTDPDKLQKQFDFMEQHNEYVMCFHNAMLINEVNTTSHFFGEYDKSEYTGTDLFENWIIPTASIFFKNVLPKELPDFFKHATHGDLALFVYLAEFGKVKYLEGVMSVYRVNSNGSTQSLLKGISHNVKHLYQLELMVEYFGEKYKGHLKQRMANYLMPTGYLYARAGDKKNAMMCFKKAWKMKKTETLRFCKYFFGSVYYFIKS